ncbi:hypothetical protein F8S13_20005 [Chloroflexia bacterium SDU3-3]|nr:hypothetical protein F8S13_20005 [Chloroflexia bacterium SDU3-3]
MLSVPKRYVFLRVVIVLMRIVAALFLVMSFVAVFSTVVAREQVPSFWAFPSLMIGLAPAAAAGPLLLFSELFRVFLDIEENTRATAVGLEDLAQAVRSLPSSSGDIQTLSQSVRFLADDVQQLHRTMGPR